MNLEEQYAHAIHEASLKKGHTTHALFTRMYEALKRRNHEKLLPRILAEYEKIAANAKSSQMKISIAHEKDKKPALDQLKALAPEDQTFELCEDKSLVSGYVIEGRDFRYDASGKRSLLNLYNRLVRNS